MAKVSVIIAVYNAEAYVEKCVESLLGQTLQEIEIIAINDGSTDSSEKILAGFAAKSVKFKYYTIVNGGAAKARNFGLTLATGEYVGYVDSDDFVDPEMYKLMYDKAAENSCDIVECNLHHTYDGGEDTEVMERYYTPGELICFGRYVVWNKIYRREFLIEAEANFPASLIYEDVSFVAKLVPYIKKYDYISEAPVHYVQRQNSVNNSKSVKTMDIFTVLDDISVFYKKKGFYDQYKNELEYLYARILLCSSFKRMCRIPDKTLRNKALRLNYRKLTDNYKNWKKNPVLKSENSRNAFFMKMQSPFIYKLSCLIFPVLLRVKKQIGPDWR